MNEIRHQAMVELQKLVMAAENKMIELVAAERTKINGNGKTLSSSLQISPSLIPQYNVNPSVPSEARILIQVYYMFAFLVEGCFSRITIIVFYIIFWS